MPQSTAASFVRREFKRHLFVVDFLDKQMQNEKELIRLASAGVGGLFFICMKKQEEHFGPERYLIKQL